MNTLYAKAEDIKSKKHRNNLQSGKTKEGRKALMSHAVLSAILSQIGALLSEAEKEQL